MAMLLSHTSETVSKICKWLGVKPELVRRIVIDIDFESPAVAYIEMYASTKKLEISMADPAPKVEILE